MALLFGVLFLPFALLATTPPEFITEPEIKPNSNPSVPLAAVIKFTPDQPVATEINVTDGENSWTIFYDYTHDPVEGLPVVGMRPGKEHQIHVAMFSSFKTRTEAEEVLTFSTPELPEDPERFPEIEVVSEVDPSSLEPGFTLASVRRRGGEVSGTDYGMLLAMDSAGEIVWYYTADHRISDFERLKNGNIIYLTYDHRAIEIDVLGNKIASWYAAGGPFEGKDGISVDTATFHHEIDELPNGNLLVLGSEVREIEDYYTSEEDAHAPRKKQKVMGDQIIEFQRDGQVVWRWHAFDHLDPFRIGYETFTDYWPDRGFPEVLDWSHGNGLDYVEEDDALLLSLRFQDAIVKIDRKTGELRWILGGEDGWGDNLKPKVLKPEGEVLFPWHQHAPSMLPDGQVLLYNNLNHNRRPFSDAADAPEKVSRAMIYQVDPEAMTVKQVWESQSVGDSDARLSMAMGDADLLPHTGNVLVCLGGSEPIASEGPEGVAFREYSRDPTEKLWELRLKSGVEGMRWIAFGGARITEW